MSDASIDRVYKLTVIRAPEITAIEGLSATFFEELETITEITHPQRIKFKVEKHLLKIPNQAEVTLTNLSSISRENLTGGPAKIRLEAGYDDTPRLLFIGDVRFASPEHTGTEWDVKLQIADGGRAYAEARHNRSYATGTPMATIIGDLCKAFGTSLPANIPTMPELQTRAATGEVVTGWAADELSRLLAPFGMEWSFQNGHMQIMRSDEIVPGVLRVISQDSGMIGAPAVDPPKIRAPRKRGHRSGRAAELKVPKLKIKHELYPELIPGERIQVHSRSINGEFRIDSVVHEGDLWGSDWTTHIEGRSV
jgi:hypothetical protein